jgi:putative transposase
MERPVRKRIRLPSEAYVLAGTAWLVSIATAERIPAFADPIFGGLVAAIFEERAVAMDVGLDLYCFMPDHVHLLVQIKTAGLVDYIRDVKSRTTREWWSFGGTGPLWQRSFHDHGIRTPSDYDAAVSYILKNPANAELVESWESYSLIGGSLISSEYAANS